LKKLQFPFLLLLALGIAATACNTRKAAKNRYTEAKGRTPFDVIIVPGIPYHPPQWDSVMKARVLWSWILYKNGYAKNVIYSGGAVYSPYVESLIMSYYGEKLGIPRQHIFQDTQARHSTENVYYSYLLAKKLGFKSIAVATDPFQSFMLRGFTRRRFGTPIYHLPFITDSLAVYNSVDPPAINPAPAYRPDYVNIKEEKNYWQRMKGTIGRNINWRKYPNGMLPPL